MALDVLARLYSTKSESLKNLDRICYIKDETEFSFAK
jgi:hypothetical protein